MQQSFSGVAEYTFLTLESLQVDFHTLIVTFPSLQNYFFFGPSLPHPIGACQYPWWAAAIEVSQYVISKAIQLSQEQL